MYHPCRNPSVCEYIKSKEYFLLMKTNGIIELPKFNVRV